MLKVLVFFVVCLVLLVVVCVPLFLTADELLFGDGANGDDVGVGDAGSTIDVAGPTYTYIPVEFFSNQSRVVIRNVPSDARTKYDHNINISLSPMYTGISSIESVHYYYVKIPVLPNPVTIKARDFAASTGINDFWFRSIYAKNSSLNEVYSAWNESVGNETNQTIVEHEAVFKNYTAYYANVASKTINTDVSVEYLLELHTNRMVSGQFNLSVLTNKVDPDITCGGALDSDNTVYTMSADCLINVSTAYTVTAQNVTLDCQGFAVAGNNSFGMYGVYTTKPNTTVRNCNITGFETSIYYYIASNGTIENNLINVTVNRNTEPTYASGIILSSVRNAFLNNNTASSQNSIGIYFISSYNSTVNNSNGSSQLGLGMFIRNSENITITNSNASSNKSYGLEFWTGNNNILNNVYASSNTSYGIYMVTQSINNRFTNVLAQSNTSYGVDIEASSNNTFDNLTALSNTSYGIYLGTNANNNRIFNSIGASNGSYGINLASNSNNALINVTGKSQSNYGVYLSTSLNNTLINVTGSSNASYGIYLISGSNNNQIFNSIGASNGSAGLVFAVSSNNNTVINITGKSQSLYGIWIQTGSNNIFDNLTGSSNTSVGIYFQLNSNNNQIFNSIGASNGSYGVYLTGSSNNTLINTTGKAQTGTGILIEVGSTNNTLNNITGTSNASRGIWIATNANHNILTNSIGASNGSNGVYITTSNNITLINVTARSDYQTALLFDTISNTTLNNVTGTSNASAGIGFQTNSNHILIHNSIGASNGSTGISIGSTCNNFTLINVTGNSDSGMGISIVNSKNNTLTNVTGKSKSSSGIKFETAAMHSTLTNINATSISSTGITIDNTCNNITINDSYFNSTSGAVAAVYLQGANITMINTTIDYLGSGYSFCTDGSYNYIRTVRPNGSISITGHNNTITDITSKISITSHHNNVTNSNITTAYGYAVYIGPGYGNIIDNITASTSSSSNTFRWESGATRNYINNSRFTINSATILFAGLATNNTVENTILNGTTTYAYYSNAGYANNTFINVTFNTTSSQGIYLNGALNNLFINCTNEITYNGTTAKFFSDQNQNETSTGNKGWWPRLTSNGADASTQVNTSWYNGTSGGHNATGTYDATLKYWYNNNGITVDSISPFISFNVNSTATGMYKNTGIFASINASDSIQVWLMNITLYNSTGSLVLNNTLEPANTSAQLNVNFTTLTDGVYYLNATVNDSVGNINMTETRSITLDNIAPFIAFNVNTTADGLYANTAIFGSVNGSDNMGFMVNLTLWNASGTLVLNKTDATGRVDVNFTGLVDGVYYLNATINDTAGNWNSTAKKTITLDNAAPTIVFNANTTQPGTYANTGIFASINSSDAYGYLSNITLFNASGTLVLNATSTSSPLEVNFSGLSDGTYYLNASANDSVGNWNYTNTITITLDNTAPPLVFNLNTTVVGNLSFFEQLFASVNSTGSEAINISLYNGSQRLLLFNSSADQSEVNFSQLTSMTGEGYYYVNASSYDALNNMNYTDTLVYYVDPNAPFIAFNINTTADNGFFKNTGIFVSVNASDTFFNFTNITLWNAAGGLVLNKTGETGQLDFNFTGLGPGRYYFNATAWDNRTHSNSTATYSVYIDEVNPFIAFNVNTTVSGNLSANNFFASVNASDDSTFFVNITAFNSTGSLVLNFTSINTQPEYNFTGLSAGTYYLNASVNDSFGNWNYTETIVYAVDLAFPFIYFNTNTTMNGTYSNTGIFGSVNASDDVEVWLLNMTLFNSTGSPVLNSTVMPANGSVELNFNFTGLSDGTYYLNATVNDSVGRVNHTYDTRNISLDNTNPFIAFNLNTSATGNVSYESLYVSINCSDLNFDSSNISLYNGSGTRLLLFGSSLTQPEINFSQSTPLTGDGYYYVNASCTDDVFNVNYSETIVYYIDGSSPFIAFNVNTTQSGAYRNTGIFGSVNASDTFFNFTNMTLWNATNGFVLNQTDTTGRLDYNFTGLRPGWYYLNATAFDNRTHSSGTGSYYILVDEVPPFVAFNLNTTVSGNHSVSGIFGSLNTTDDTGFSANMILWNSVGVAVFNMSDITGRLDYNFTGLTDSVYYLNASANDTLGNVNYTITIVYDVDSKNPFIKFNLNTTLAGVYRNTGIFGSVNASDAHYNFTNLTLFNVTGQLVLNYTNTSNFTEINLTGLANGWYYLNATAWDNFTHSNITETRKIGLDTIYPSIILNLNSTPTGSYDNTAFFVSVNASDNLAIGLVNISIYNYTGSLMWNITNTSNGNWGFNISLPAGSYYYNASVVDNASFVNYSETRNVNTTLTAVVTPSGGGGATSHDSEARYNDTEEFCFTYEDGREICVNCTEGELFMKPNGEPFCANCGDGYSADESGNCIPVVSGGVAVKKRPVGVILATLATAMLIFLAASDDKEEKKKKREREEV